jgi:hypothetical protein
MRDVPEELTFLAEVCYLPCPVLDCNADPDDGDSSEQISEHFSAKILFFWAGFVILPTRA